MAFHDDFDFEIERDPQVGDVVAFRATTATAAPLLPAHETAVLELTAIGGEIRVDVESLDPRDPTRLRVVGPADPDPVEEWNRLPFIVELFGPDGLVETWQAGTNGWSTTSGSEFRHVAPAVSAPGPWNVHVTNRGTVRASVQLGASAVVHRTPMRTQPLALSLLNHAYRVILEALTPSAAALGDRIEWSFGAELKAHAGNAGGALGTHVKVLPEGLTVRGRMDTFSLRGCAADELLAAARRRWEQGDLRQATTEWLQGWERDVRPNQPTIHVQVAFTDIRWSFETSVWLIDIKDNGLLDDVVIDVYLALTPTLTGGRALVLSPAKFVGGALDVAEDLGIVEELSAIIEEELPKVLQPASIHIGRFLGEALARLALKDAMFIHLLATGSSWDLAYALPPGTAPTGGGGGGRGPRGPAGTVPSRPIEVDPRGGGSPTGSGTEPGPMPPEFVVHAPETLTRLDQVDTIVVLMMENRSFDHMLGHLAHMPGGERYGGFTGSENNRVSNRQEPVQLRPATEVMVGVVNSHGQKVPVTAIQVSPQHDMANVLDQIADGTMSGFAQDIEERSTGAADLAMTYYTEAELPTYYALARQFAVCDHWFAAHPGATWPNRWATLSGTSPSAVNPAIHDPDIAYVDLQTIFSWLSTYGIEWRVFESDLSLVRTYNRHRLDSERVLPLGVSPRDGIGLGEGTSFWDLAARGIMPPVVFIEPNFSDIPPLATANDDLAPADLRMGQALVAQIVDALTKSPQWERTMLVITYDEHGGFYDHVPPPGTVAGPPEWLGRIPKIARDGADHLGVRVPTLVVSPLVSPSSVSKVVFDHTAVIKTILLRHRARLSTNVFTAFGERVLQSAHLGQVLDHDRPRVVPPTALAATWFGAGRRPGPEDRIAATGEVIARTAPGGGESEVSAILRSAFMPKR